MVTRYMRLWFYASMSVALLGLWVAVLLILLVSSDAALIGAVIAILGLLSAATCAMVITTFDIHF